MMGNVKDKHRLDYGGHHRLTSAPIKPNAPPIFIVKGKISDRDFLYKNHFLRSFLDNCDSSPPIFLIILVYSDAFVP